MTDDLIREHIRDAECASPEDARLVEQGVPVWLIVAYDQAQGGDTEAVAETYHVSTAAVDAARAYYRRHQALLDARMLLATQAFTR